MTIPKLALHGLDTVQHTRRVAESINNILSFESDDGRRQTNAEREAGVIPTNYAYPPPDVRRYGAVLDSAADDSDALNRALSANQYAFIPDTGAASLRIESTVSVPDNKRICGIGLGSRITKGANGAMLSLGRNSKVEDLYLDGSGGTYTGVGITIPFTAEFEGFQQINRCRIYDMESYCVQYVSSTKAAGFASKIYDCDMQVAGNEVATVQWGADPTNSHGNRTLLICSSPSGPLVDINTADNGFIIGCTIGDNGTDSGIIWNEDCAKIICIGNRVGSTTTMVLSGQSCVFSGNIVGSGVTLDSGWIGSRYADNVIAGTFTDNSAGQQNEVDAGPLSYTPTWTGASSNPSLGDGTIAGVYTRKGRLVDLTINLDIGSTTTFGTGEWRFSLPVGASDSQPSWGSALLYDSSGTPVVGTIFIAASATYGVIFMHGVTGTVNATAPFTWADGDFIRTTVTYISV